MNSSRTATMLLSRSRREQFGSSFAGMPWSFFLRPTRRRVNGASQLRARVVNFVRGAAVPA